MKRRTDFIIPECYVDTNLVETLVCSGGCNHQKGCNQVAKVMKGKFANRFAVGMIDADKRRPGYLNEFRKIATSEYITLLHHSSRQHFIILIHPAADGFILSCAEAANIDMGKFELSPELKEFTTQTKNVMSNKDSRFKKLFISIKDLGEMKLLNSALHYLVNATYKAKDEDLILLFNDSLA